MVRLWSALVEIARTDRAWPFPVDLSAAPCRCSRMTTDFDVGVLLPRRRVPPT
jgi:hypothetical protein